MRKDTDKTLFFVIGSSRGLGKELVSCLKKISGATIVAPQRSELDLSKLLQKNALSRLFLPMCSAWDHVYLIANASVVEPIGQIGTLNSEELAAHAHTNFVSYMQIINTFIAESRHISGEKKILAISSGAAASAHEGLACYCATKAALEMFVRCIHKEQLQRKNFQIMAFRPGVMDTDMQTRLREASAEEYPHRTLHSSGKLRSPKSVAQTIEALLLTKRYWNKPVRDITEFSL